MRGDAFERLYEEHARSLLAFLAYRTGDPALAEDLLADTFERVLRTRRRFDPRKASEKTWLYSIALNCLRDNARRQSAEARALERAETRVGAGTNVGSEESLEHRDELSHALEQLSREEREVIALRYGADLTIREMASVLGEKRTTVEGRLYRGLGKLRPHLEDRS